MNEEIITERTDTENNPAHIDQEVVEFTHLNTLTEKNRDNDNRRRAYNKATVKYMLTCFAVSGAVMAGWAAGLISPLVSHPLTLICLCMASERLGEWRANNRRKKEVK